MLSDDLYPRAQRLGTELGLMPDRVKRDNRMENQSVEIVTENIPRPAHRDIYSHLSGTVDILVTFLRVCPERCMEENDKS